MKIIDSNHQPAGTKPTIFRRLLTRFFAYESMSGAGRCPVYLERWVLFDRWKHGVYLHHFIGDDWAIDPHDHPRRFISIGLWGWYWEDVYLHPENDPATALLAKLAGHSLLAETLKFRAPWFRSFPAHHLHRVRASECGNCWTLVIVLPKSRGWGFVRDGVWIPFKTYVFGGKARVSC